MCVKPQLVKEIDGNLESMQEIVGGYIEAIYPFDDPIALVCNDEGKINRPPTEENFNVLSYMEVQKYMEIMCDGIVVVYRKRSEDLSERDKSSLLFEHHICNTCK